MTDITVDASSPPLVTGASLSSTVTTAAFSPPANTVLVACVVANASTTGDTTSAIVDNKGLVWTQRLSVSYSTEGINQPGHVALYTAPNPNAQTGMTVTANTLGSTSSTRRPTLRVLVLNNADLEYPYVDGDVFWSDDNTYTTGSFPDPQLENDSFQVVVASDWQKRGVPTATGFDSYQAFDQAGTDGVSGVVGYKQMDYSTGGFRFPYSIDAPGTSAAAWLGIRAEIRPVYTGVTIKPRDLQIPFRVEVAFGADLTTDESEWTWTNITDRIRIKDGVHVKIGRGDEASKAQPALCEFTANNSDNYFSIDGSSPNWPYIRRGLPIKVSARYTNTWRTHFIGYADGFSPEWNLKGNDATVKVSASGALRKLANTRLPIQSPLRRSIMFQDSVVAYWPAEEGKNAEVVKQAVGNREMIVTAGTNLPNFAAATDFDSSYPLPKLNDSKWRGITSVPPPASTGYIGLRTFFEFPASGGISDGNQLMSVWTNGQVELWQVRYSATNNIKINAWSGGVQILDSLIGPFDLLGTHGLMTLTLEQSGANINYSIDWLPYPGNVTYFASGTINTKTLGAPTLVDINWDGGNEQVAVGHIAVYNSNPGAFSDSDALRAYSGDYSGTRFSRAIEDEAGIPVIFYVTGEEVPFELGPQPLATVSEIVDDATRPGQILVTDGTDQGLTFWDSSTFINQPVAAVFDVANGELAPPFEVVQDDRGIHNRVTITRTDGASITVEQTDGDLSTDAIGIYDLSEELNFYDDSYVEDAANWRLMQGTVGGVRVPKVTLSLAHTPTLFPFLDQITIISDRIDIENLHQVLLGAPVEPIRLLVEGYEFDFTSHNIEFVANCSDNDRWRVGELGDTTTSNDTEYVQRLDTAGAQLNASVLQGASSMTVATTVPPLFTTTATRPNDFPFYVEVEGIRVKVTGITGTTSPQTFTVDPATVTRSLSSGASVSVSDVGALMM